jgi:hypothetical protein
MGIITGMIMSEPVRLRKSRECLSHALLVVAYKTTYQATVRVV